MAYEVSQMLAEHQGVENTGNKSSATYDPSEDESKAIKLAESLFEKSKKARKAYDENGLITTECFEVVSGRTQGLLIVTLRLSI